MSGRKLPGEQLPPRGPALDSNHDERYRSSDRRRDTRDVQITDDDYDSPNRRMYSSDRDKGTRRSRDRGDRSDRGSGSFEKTSLTNAQSFNLNDSTLRTSKSSSKSSTTNVAKPSSEGTNRRTDSITESTSTSEIKSDNMGNPSELISVQEEPSKAVLTNMFEHFANLVSSRGILQQVQNSTQKSLKEQLDQIKDMAPAMLSFPTHREAQFKRRAEIEEILKTTNEELNKVKGLEKEAIEAIASLLVIKATPQADNSTNVLQERCLKLEDKIGELESTVARMDQRDKFSKINEGLEDLQSKHRDIVGKLQANEVGATAKFQTTEANLTGKFQKKYQSISDEHANLSAKYKKLEEQLLATRTDFDSARGRLSSHGESVQKHEAAINISKQEMATLQQQITQTFATITAKDNDIDKITRKVVDLQKSLDTHQSSFDHLNSSNHLERLNKVENTNKIVVELQNQYQNTLANIEKLQGELSALKDKVIHIESAPPRAPYTPAPEVTPTLSGGSKLTMVGVMQNKIYNLERDVRSLQERSPGAANRSLSQDDALVNEQPNITRFESRLINIEDSMKELRSLSIGKPAMKISPFSTATQEQVELKKTFELYRAEQKQIDQGTKQCFEGLKTEIKAIQRDNIAMKEQINAIEEKLAVIPQIQDGMKEFLNRLTESSTQMETRLNNRLNGFINSQNGNTLAITQLNSRMANISTADLAKNMLGQLETLYPNVRNAETILSEHKGLLLDHAAQFVKLKSQITVLESQPVRKQSPVPSSNRATDSLRQEVDALSKDQIQLESATKTNQASLAALAEANATIKKALDSLTKKVIEEKKRLDSMEEAFSEEVADLSVKVDGLLPDSESNTTLADATSSTLPSFIPVSRQSSAQEAALNRKKRKAPTGAEETQAAGSMNGYPRSSLTKRAKIAEDDNEDLELLE